VSNQKKGLLQNTFTLSTENCLQIKSNFKELFVVAWPQAKKENRHTAHRKLLAKQKDL